MKAARWILTVMAVAGPSIAQPPSDAPAPPPEHVPRIVVDGRVVQTDVLPRIVRGTTLIPLRFVVEALGARMTWDPRAREAVIVYEGQRTVIQAGEDTLVAGDRSIQLRTPVQVIQGRTMVPLRAVAESLGATLRWDPATRTVYVTTPPAPPAPTPAPELRQSLAVDLRTDQQTYAPGTPIELTLRLENQGDQPVRLQMSSGQQYDFLVLRDGQEVWRWSQGRSFIQTLTSLVLAPEETRSFTVTWDQRDAQGNPVPPGQYILVGRITHTGSTPLEEREVITIVAP
ncbi:MAG: hypothetical protein GX774_13400 [Armatimonadetes bacterium]|nr:hypothetical protein [Armatimonadota bacterium]